jgi:sterol 3beta-glucosyltransferase
VHEGAETPIVGAVAAVAGFATTLGTNTADFSERLRRPAEVSHSHPVTGEKVPGTPETDRHVQPDSPSPGQLEIMAQRMALKTYEDNLNDNLKKPVRGQSRLDQTSDSGVREEGQSWTGPANHQRHGALRGRCVENVLKR